MDVIRRLSPARLMRAALTASVLVVVPAPLLAQQNGPQQDGPQIDSFVLDNGLQVVVIPDHRAPIVTHMLWYKVGSADEAPGKSGIAHFFEHLMFKGTENYGPGIFSARVADVGGQENAFTSYDYTAYYQQVAPDILPEMMAMEADRMTNLILTDEVIGPERDVVIEERNMRVENAPGSLLSEEVSATLYQNHPYRIPVIGWMHEIEQLNREDGIEFYRRYYAPNNAVLVVAGDVETETVRQLAEDTYGKVARGPDLPERLRPSEPEQNTRRSVTLNDERVGVPSFSKQWVVPSYTTATDNEAASLDLLSEILGGGVRSRLYQELVVDQGIASSAAAYYQGTALDDSMFVVMGSPRGEATLEDVEKAIDVEIAKIAAEGISTDELEAAQNRFVRAMIFARDEQSGMARIYGSTLTTGGSVEDIAAWPDHIRAVTTDEVQAAAARWLDERRAVAGYLLPKE